jgi:hypothetical protein
VFEGSPKFTRLKTLKKLGAKLDGCQLPSRSFSEGRVLDKRYVEVLPLQNRLRSIARQPNRPGPGRGGVLVLGADGILAGR